MKRSLVLLGTFTGMLILVALFLIMRERSAQPGKQFQIKDTDRIRRVVFRRDTAVLVLRERDGVWQADGRWPVRERAVKVLKKVLGEIQVKSPLSGDRLQHFLQDTAGTHIFVAVLSEFCAIIASSCFAFFSRFS